MAWCSRRVPGSRRQKPRTRHRAARSVDGRMGAQAAPGPGTSSWMSAAGKAGHRASCVPGIPRGVKTWACDRFASLAVLPADRVSWEHSFGGILGDRLRRAAVTAGDLDISKGLCGRLRVYNRPTRQSGRGFSVPGPVRGQSHCRSRLSRVSVLVQPSGLRMHQYPCLSSSTYGPSETVPSTELQHHLPLTLPPRGSPVPSVLFWPPSQTHPRVPGPLANPPEHPAVQAIVRSVLW